MKFLKWLAIALAAVVLAIAALVVGARFADGPIGPLPGGPLQDGELITGPVSDWAFVADVETLEMQLLADDNRARTTWVLYLDGAGYIPVTLGFPPSKSWHHLAADDGAAVVRIAGKRYPVTLSKVEDPALLAALDAANSAKYPPAPGSGAGSWYFELVYRGSEG